MTKKIISFVTAVVMLFQLQAVLAADAGSEAVQEADYKPYQTSAEFLKGLNITEDSERFSESVTRGMAAKLLCAMLDESDSLQNYRGIFKDVDESNENALYIEKLADLGIVKGDENLNYRPDDVLLYDEASYLFAYTLGFGLIQGDGETPQKTIARFGIMDNVKAEYDFVITGDFYVMMRNALLSNLFVQETYGSDPTIYQTDQTLLYKIYKIVYADGIITKDDVTSLWSAESRTDGYMGLQLKDGSEIRLKTDSFDKIRADLGKSVRVYYKSDDSSSRLSYVYHEIDDYNRTLDIRLEMIETGKSEITAGGKVSYYTDETRARTAKLAQSINIIYNGAAYKDSSFDLSAAGGKTGNAELIDADGDGSYETVKLNLYESVIVNNISTDHGYINDKYTAGKTIDIDEENYTKIFVYDSDGNETDISAVVPGCTVSAAKSETYTQNDILTLRISTQNINGKVTKYKNGSFAPLITIDGDKTFMVFDRAAEKEYKENVSVMVYIDFLGNAVYVSDDYQRDMQYGVLAGINKKSAGFSSEITVKLVSATGEVNEYKLDSRVVIDGKSYNNKENDAYDALSNVTVKIGTITLPNGVYPIRYRLDDTGMTVKNIDTRNFAENSEDDSLEFLGGGNYYVNSGQIFGWTIPYATDALVFEFSMSDYSNPDSYRDERSISIGTASQFRVSTSYNVAAFKSDKDSDVSDFIIKFNYSDGNISYDNNLFVIEDIMNGYIPETGETKCLISGYLKGVATQFWVDKDYEGINEIKSLKKGDIIRYDTISDGRLVNYETILKQETGGYTTYDVNGGGLRVDWGTSVTILCGYVYSVDNTLVRTNVFSAGTVPKNASGLDWNQLLNDGELRYTNLTSGTAITTVDFENDKIKSGSVGDLLDYKNLKDESSLFVAKFRSGRLEEAIIYNK